MWTMTEKWKNPDTSDFFFQIHIYFKYIHVYTATTVFPDINIRLVNMFKQTLFWKAKLTETRYNFPFLSSDIPSSPAYGVFISQLIRYMYARATSSHECFILRTVRLSNKLLGQGYVKERLRSSLRKFYGRYGDFIQQYEVPLSRMLHDMDDDHLQ